MTHWIPGEDMYGQETLSSRREIDGVPHLFRAVRNRHYASTRWDLDIVDAERSYGLRLTSLKAVKEIVASFRPDMIERGDDEPEWSRYRWLLLGDGTKVEIRNHNIHRGWTNRYAEQWVLELLTPVEIATRAALIAKSKWEQAAQDERDAKRALDEASAALAQALEAEQQKREMTA